MSLGRCSRRYCGAPLTERHDRSLGRIAVVCVPCEMNVRGLCRDCSKPLGRQRKDAMRCTACMKARVRSKSLASHRRDRADPSRRAKINAWQRAYNMRPEVRAKRLTYNRRYRAAQKAKTRPRTAADRLYINEWQKSRYWSNPAYREKMKRKASIRRARRAARLREEKLASGLYRVVKVRRKKSKSGVSGERFVRLLRIDQGEARRAS